MGCIKKTITVFLAVPLVALASTGGWTLETLQDKATYQNVAVLHQESIAAISDEYAMKEVSPRLEFRCLPASGDRVTVRIDWRRFISSFNTEVQFQAGDREAITVKLGVDRSNKITSTRDAGDDSTIIDYLAGQSELALTVTPYSEVPVTVNYDLEGFAEQLAELRASCAG